MKEMVSPPSPYSRQLLSVRGSVQSREIREHYLNQM